MLATIGRFKEEAWRSDPNLRLLRAEIEGISNPQASQYNPDVPKGLVPYQVVRKHL